MLDQIDTLLPELSAPNSPGAAVGLQFRGQRFVRCLGLANVEMRVPVTPATRFRIASVTKPVLASLTLTLARDGILDMTASIRRSLPDLSTHFEDITIRHLLSCTSGIRDYYELLHYSGVGAEWPIDMPQILDRIFWQRSLQFSPGESYLYSNTGFLLLSEMIERRTGRDIADLYRERICEPLGLSSTGLVRSNGDLVADMASAYVTSSDGRLIKPVATLPAHGGGGLVSSINDLLALADYWRRNCVDRNSLLAEMFVPTILSGGYPAFHGLGMFVRSYRGARFFGYSGLQPGYRTHFACYPDHDLIVTLITNLDQVDPLGACRRIVDHILKDKLPAQSKATLADLAGKYVDPESGESVEIVAGPRGLLLKEYGSTFAIEPYDADALLVPQSLRERVLTCANESLGLMDVSNGSVRYYARSHSRGSGNGIPAGDYTGVFTIDDLDATLTVSEDRAGLHLRIASELGYSDFDLVSIDIDRFVACQSRPQTLMFEPLMCFDRDGRGAVTGITTSFVLTKGLRARRQ